MNRSDFLVSLEAHTQEMARRQASCCLVFQGTEFVSRDLDLWAHQRGATLDLSRQAREAMARMRDIDPTLRVSNIEVFVPFRRPEDFDRYVQGLRKAGPPE